MNYNFSSSTLIAIIFTLIGCGKQSEKTTSNTVIALDSIMVETNIVDNAKYNPSTILSGIIQSTNEATVSAQVMGYITSLSVDVGDQVRAGQRIITIEGNQLNAKQAQVSASLSEAEAALDNIKINYDRMETLWNQSSITKKEWDDIKTQYSIMLAKVETARQMRNEVNYMLDKTIVTSPISGVIVDKMINKGDLVNPGVPLLLIEGNQSYEVKSYVSEKQISNLKLGMHINCYIKAIDKTVKANITEISPSARKSNGQFAFKATLEIPTSEKKLIFPGMYVNVLLKGQRDTENETSTTVEKSALFRRGQLTGIYTISNQNTALLRWIRTGKDFGERVEILSGITTGEEYITNNQSLLKDGIPVIRTVNK